MSAAPPASETPADAAATVPAAADPPAADPPAADQASAAAEPTGQAPDAGAEDAAMAAPDATADAASEGAASPPEPVATPAAAESAAQASEATETAAPAAPTAEPADDAAEAAPADKQKKKNKSPQPNLQRKEILKKLLLWTAETTVEYNQEGKRTGTVSGERFQKYRKAKTVAEALELGSSPEDIINDYMKGILKVTGGKLREKPSTVEELQRGDATDQMLVKFAKGFHKEQIAEELTMDMKEAASQCSWCESPVMHMKRLKAAKVADEILCQLAESGGQATDEHMLSVMRLWAFRRNPTRKNVAPADRALVDSECFGTLRNQAGVFIVTKATSDYPAVTKLILKWLRDSLPMQDFAFSSIQVNSGFACRRHRDRDNLGAAVVRAIGDFTGGSLWYWPEDDGLAAIDQLPKDARVELDLHSAPAIIDGNRAHETEPFEGERFSFVFHNIAQPLKIPECKREELVSYGFTLPDKEAVLAARSAFAPPKGYGLQAEPTAPKKRKEVEDSKQSDRKRFRKADKGKRAGESLLAKLCRNAKMQEAAVAQGAKDTKKPRGGLKQAVLKLRGKDEPKKQGALKMKNKAGISGGLLARMMEKREAKKQPEGASSKGGSSSSSREAPAASSSADASKKTAAEPGAAPLPKLSKVMAGGLLARVIAKKAKKSAASADSVAAAPLSAPAAAASSAGDVTPPRKRSGEAACGASSKKQGVLGKPQAAKAEPPAAIKAERAAAATAVKAEPTLACARPAPAAAVSAPAVVQPAAAAVAAPPPAALPAAAPAPAFVAPPAAFTAAPSLGAEAAKAAAASLGLTSVGREAVQAQHFLPFANVLRRLQEEPAASVAVLVDYFQVLLHLGEQPEELLRVALGLLLPEGSVADQDIAAALAAAFGPSTAQLVQDKGLAEAAQEARKAKRSLRAPPPRLGLGEVAEALRAPRSEELARVLGAARADGGEAFFLVKVLQGAARPPTGAVHAAIARALVRAGRGAC